ncbi:MAG: hypothetical protein ABSB96_08830 [Gaiellaceae bacterium]
MSETLLFERLDELVEDCSGALGDWDEVLRRAQVAATPAALGRRLRRPSRRVLAWAVVVASLLVILFATPAFGLLRNWIGRMDVPFSGKSAPYEAKRDFADLSIGAPRGMDPQAIVSESRKVATFKVSGKTVVLYVAPTRKGGFCWSFNAGGSCLSSRPTARTFAHTPRMIREEKLWLLSVESRFAFGPLDKRDRGKPRAYVYYMPSVSGVVLAAKAAALRLVFEDGSSAQIPFVWVSKPIDAGFFLYGVPSEHLRAGSRPVSLSELDSRGRLIARQTFLWKLIEREGRRFEKQVSSPKPSPTPPPQPLPRLKPPLQQGQAKGVSVVAGKNGAVIIDFSHASESVRSVIAKGVDWGCFSFMPYHESDPAGLETTLSPLRMRGGSTITGISTPFDGCQVEGMYGRRWPDRFHSHAVVEIALSPRGKRYFADHAAAADLALFLRLRPMLREIRRLSGEELSAALRDRFGSEIEQLPSATTPLPAGRIGYVEHPGGATYLEHSTTGRRFSVTIENGKITAQNVRALTLVY